MENSSPPKLPARGIYLLPNLLTLSALFAGFYAIVASIHNHFEASAIAILISIVFDGLDGRVARMTHTQTPFGAQLDSLSDMVCFGVAPALLLYNWSLSALGKFGWLVAFLYAACTALRLARFNVQLGKMDKRYFQGLATPAAAAFIASAIWTCHSYGIAGDNVAIIFSILSILIAFLKVSTFRYRSFKDFKIQEKVPFLIILLIVLIIVLISIDPSDLILFITFLYIISGPIGTIWELKKKRQYKHLQKLNRSQSNSQSNHANHDSDSNSKS